MEDWNEWSECWNRAYIQIMDVRRLSLDSRDSDNEFELPANSLILAFRGNATIGIDREEHAAEGFYIAHAGKGQRFRLKMHSDSFEYYHIYYRAWFVFPRLNKEATRASSAIMKQPFGFVPANPLLLLDRAETLYQAWRRETPFGKLHAKGCFYLFVHDFLQQAEERALKRQEDIADQIIRYIQTNYAESITLETVSGKFHYSSRYLSKLFKRQTGQGLIDYLIRFRIGKAQQLLGRTDATVKEVAQSVGYTDLFYFIRLFKKHVGVSPKLYKKKVGEQERGVHSPYERTGLSIVANNSPRYIDEVNENHYQYNEGDWSFMFNRLKNRRGAMLLLGLTLIISACSNSPAAVGNASPAPSQSAAITTPAQSEAPAGQEAQQMFPRTYIDPTGKEIVIEKQPERIAVGHFGEMEYFFALGVPPVASPLAEEILNEFTVTLGEIATTADVADLGDVMSPNLEKLLTVEPDLIIGSVGLHEEVYDSLQQIAPVVMLDLAGEWKSSLREYASIIGKEEQAEAYIAELSEELRTAGELLKPFRHETTALFRFSGPLEFGAMGKAAYGYFYDTEEGLGLTAPESYPDRWETIALEGLSEMNPDHLIIADYASSYESKLAELGQLEVWNSLKAVQNGNVHFLDIAAATNGPYAIKYAVKTVVDSYTK